MKLTDIYKLQHSFFKIAVNVSKLVRVVSFMLVDIFKLITNPTIAF